MLPSGRQTSASTRTSSPPRIGSGQVNTGRSTQSEFSPGAWFVLEPSNPQIGNSVVPASMILHFWKFVLRPATTDLGRDVGAIESFLEGHGDRVKELQDALAKAGGNQGPIATGLGPLLGTVRSLDLLHGFVLALPVSVDFLGIYARRAREAIEEARVDGGAS